MCSASLRVKTTRYKNGAVQTKILDFSENRWTSTQFLAGSGFSFHQKDTGNREISKSTFQKHITSWGYDFCEKSFGAAKMTKKSKFPGNWVVGTGFELEFLNSAWKMFKTMLHLCIFFLAAYKPQRHQIWYSPSKYTFLRAKKIFWWNFYFFIFSQHFLENKPKK